MSFIFSSPKGIVRKQSRSAQKVLDKLQSFLEDGAGDVEKVLCGFWKDQGDALTYQEIRNAILAGELSKELLAAWRNDYSVLARKKMDSVWKSAMEAGSRSPEILENVSAARKQTQKIMKYQFSTHEPEVLNWIKDRGAAFVTSSTDEQKKAIQALLTKKVVESHTLDELSRMIRPCIGLTEGQAAANVKYYDHICSSLKKEYPKMKPSTIKKKALDASKKYAERQLRQRAMTIARTEMAFAYNRGEYESIRQAQKQNLIGKVKKHWITAGNGHVCSICDELDGTEIGMDEEFAFKGKILFEGQKLTPPAHPNCHCAVQYIEIEPPVFSEMPAMDVSITGSNSFRIYTDDEINSMAEQTEETISRHVSTPSKWSGNMVVTDDGIEDGTGHIVKYGKLWDCDIVTKHETAPAIILHEQLHARSASYFPEIIYSRFQYIEEATVQFLTEEICILEGIEIITSGYDEKVDALKKIGRYLGYKFKYDFAKELIAIPLPDRLNWLSENLYATMRKNPKTTVADYIEFSKLLDALY